VVGKIHVTPGRSITQPELNEQNIA
jgi:hypothetical protein